MLSQVKVGSERIAASIINHQMEGRKEGRKEINFGFGDNNKKLKIIKNKKKTKNKYKKY